MALWQQRQQQQRLLLLLLLVPCNVFVPVAADVCLDGKNCGAAQCCLYSFRVGLLPLGEGKLLKIVTSFQQSLSLLRNLKTPSTAPAPSACTVENHSAVLPQQYVAHAVMPYSIKHRFERLINCSTYN
ncbi:unnamed protein product [Lampetra planeri]